MFQKEADQYLGLWKSSIDSIMLELQAVEEGHRQRAAAAYEDLRVEVYGGVYLLLRFCTLEYVGNKFRCSEDRDCFTAVYVGRIALSYHMLSRYCAVL